MFALRRRPAFVAYLGFALFGALWGTWGASIPAVQAHANVDDGELGIALLFVGAGALPAMPLAGWLVDRWGQRATGALLLALAGAGLLVAATGRDLLMLSAGLAVLGAASGATDVAINAAAGGAQHGSGRPVISRAHAAFSASVVASSLGTGALLGAGLPLVVPFAVVAAAGTLVAVVLIGSAPDTGSPARRSPRAPDRLRRPRTSRLVPLLVLGVLGALAFGVENGHQSWSALYLQEVLGGGPTTAAAGPATFAAVVAMTRFATAGLGTRHPLAVLLAGSIFAVAGTTILAAATSVGAGLLGLGVAAAGTAVLFPTLLTVLSTLVPSDSRGSATSVVTTVAYLGFLGGPPYVGLWAEATGLPGAMLALAALAAILAVLSPPALRACAQRQHLRQPGDRLTRRVLSRVASSGGTTAPPP